MVHLETTCHVSHVMCQVKHVTLQPFPNHKSYGPSNCLIMFTIPCHVSCVPYHMSGVTCHLSLVTCHMSGAFQCIESIDIINISTIFHQFQYFIMVLIKEGSFSSGFMFSMFPKIPSVLTTWLVRHSGHQDAQFSVQLYLLRIEAINPSFIMPGISPSCMEL